MSGNVAADCSNYLGPLDPPEPGSVAFRFSPCSHVADRIHWRHWGQAAFQEAVEQDKPIFLLITSSWCQWCHLLDETTLSESRYLIQP